MRPLSPQLSPNSYAHPPISNYKLDFDWDESREITEAVKAKARKKAGKLACVALSSTASDAEIKWCLKYYDLGCLWVRPHPEMRPHIFDYNPRLRILRMVLTPKLVKLSPSFPFIPTLDPFLNGSILLQFSFLQTVGSLSLPYT